MSNFRDLGLHDLITNSTLWENVNSEGEQTLQLVNNTVNDVVGGKVALLKNRYHNFRMRAELRFIRHHLPEGSGGWFGFALRAQDTNNYELIWFMPNAEGENTVAYVPVAHGIVPWWSEAYNTQEKGKVKLPREDWFQAQVDVIDDAFTVTVNGVKAFTKKFAYYLKDGYPGFYVGTCTDAAFRKVSLEELG